MFLIGVVYIASITKFMFDESLQLNPNRILFLPHLPNSLSFPICAMAKATTGARDYDSVSIHLATLQWLPVKQRSHCPF